MKYASLDTETLGLDSATCDLIEVGIVLDDLQNEKPIDELPTFHCYVLPPDGKTYKGEPYAMSMHPQILRRIATKENGFRYLRCDEVVPALAEFLSEYNYAYGQTRDHPNLCFAGKNFASFDLTFMKRLVGWGTMVKLAHRSFDPCSMYARISDTRLPSTEDCCQRAGVVPSGLHTSIGDAITVVKLIRHAMKARP